MEMLKRNRRDLLKNAAAVATASLASNVWTSVSAVALDRKVGAIAIDKVLSDAVQEKQVLGIRRRRLPASCCRRHCRLRIRCRWASTIALSAVSKS
jgi:hypothetical protein